MITDEPSRIVSCGAAVLALHTALAAAACGRVGFAPADLPGDTAGSQAGGDSLPAIVARDDALTLDEDTTATLDVLANDEQAADATVRLVTSDVSLLVSVVGAGLMEIRPVANFNGAASFVYEAARGGQTGQATVSVTVLPVNDVPVANDELSSTSGLLEVTLFFSMSNVATQISLPVLNVLK